MNASDIPGQYELKRVIRQMVDDSHLPHAMLIHESEGGAGLPLALYLVQYLMCEQRNDGEPCGICPSCTKNLSHTHPDVHFVYPVNTNKRIKKTDDRHSDTFLPEWRTALDKNPYMDLLDWYAEIQIEHKQGFIGEEESRELRKKLALRSFEGGYRVFVIWHADKMNTSFANKMLKNFEEPSPKTVFLLISESPAKLLCTILSRVQVFREDQLLEKDLADFLAVKYNLEPKEAMDMAFRSEGNVNHAIKEAQHTGDPWLDEFKQWMRMAYTRDIIGLYQWSEKMARRSRDSQKQFCSLALKVLDRCYRMGWLDIHIPMEGEEAAFYKNFSPFINTSNVKGFLDLMEETSMHIERNVYEKLVWFDTGIMAIRLVHEGKKAQAAT